MTGHSSSSPGASGKDNKRKKQDSSRGKTGDGAVGGFDWHGLSAWSEANLTFLNNDADAGKFFGTQKAATLGVEYRVNDQLITGVAASIAAGGIESPRNSRAKRRAASSCRWST